MASRYGDRESEIDELKDYAAVQQDKTEAQVDSLAKIAELVIDTSESDPDEVLVLAASWLGLYASRDIRLVDVLVGGQYGSEGKGHVASYLAKDYDLLVRVGGPNAGHKVHLGDRVVTHHHLPSGTNTSQADLLIGPGAVINPISLRDEILESGVEAQRLSINPNAMIIDLQDIKDEGALETSIGSTRQGVGAATARRVMGRSGIVKPAVQLAKDVPELAPYLRSASDVLDQIFQSGGKVFLEGTQGTALSLYHGPYPHVTSRDTTVSGCLAEAGISSARVRRIIMACRTFPIRVENPPGGTSGPMRHETNWAEVARRSGLGERKLRSAERTSTTNKARRVARFDWALLRQAAALNAPTDVALTFADYIDVSNVEARRLEQLSEETIRFIERVERVAGAPVSLISTRFKHPGIIDRRRW